MIVSSYPYWRFMNKVLIIDDEDQLRGLLSRIIGLEGYEVFQADSCKNGLKQLALHDPDVVLCDVRLPDGNGVELIAEIKRVKPAGGGDHADGPREYTRRGAGDQERGI